MTLNRRALLKATATAPLAGALPRGSARAQAANTIRIGVLNDQSGTYRDITGPTGVACVRQAIQDFGPMPFQVEVLVADHQNRPDVGVALTRQWLDRDGVDMIVDVPNSAVALAVSGVTREKKVIEPALIVLIKRRSGTADAGRWRGSALAAWRGCACV